jgi:hypothetical protein
LRGDQRRRTGGPRPVFRHHGNHTARGGPERTRPCRGGPGRTRHCHGGPGRTQARTSGPTAPHSCLWTHVCHSWST